MAQRILTLSSYLFRRLLFSLSGALYILLSLVFWRIFFDPAQLTPEVDYYILVIGLFGATLSFLITLSLAARAHQAVNYPLLARLSSRVEHLTAVLLSALFFTLLLQGVVAVLATFRGPVFSFGRLLEVPPLWLSVNILAAVLALHASDLVTTGWSRVYVFGLLAILLFARGINASTAERLSGRITSLSSWFFRQGWSGIGDLFSSLSRWLAASGSNTLGNIFGIVFWPFEAISEAVISGRFRPAQALAPAIILLYATILFLLAADLFAEKDLFLTE